MVFSPAMLIEATRLETVMKHISEVFVDHKPMSGLPMHVPL